MNKIKKTASFFAFAFVMTSHSALASSFFSDVKPYMSVAIGLSIPNTPITTTVTVNGNTNSSSETPYTTQGQIGIYGGVEKYFKKLYVAGEVAFNIQFTDVFSTLGAEARAKIGYKFTDNITAYGIIGYAGRFFTFSSATYNGFQFGLGSQYAINKTVSLFGEFYVQVLGNNLGVVSSTVVIQNISVKSNIDSQFMIAPTVQFGAKVNF